MTSRRPVSRNTRSLKLERLPLAELRHGRRGKHYDLVGKIAGEIEALPDGEALRIALDGTDVPLANLRSAVTRAMTSRRVKIGTFSDGESLFVWRKTPGTARYERKRRKK
jgi:hypothetical protein